MNSDPPPDTQYIRSKTLTPESPIPVHYPEPSHIPVLHNQIDPVFNLMSTHMDQPVTTKTSDPSVIDAPEQQRPSATQVNATAVDINHEVAGYGRTTNGYEPDQGDKDYVLDFEFEDLAENMVEEQKANTPNLFPTSTVQPSTSITVDETPSHLQDADTSHSFHQTQETFSDSSQANPDPPQHIQVTAAAQDADGNPAPDSPGSSDDQAQEGGVNYQALLDNLSPSTAAAPASENVASITTAAPADVPSIPRPSSAESSIAALPLAPGLPPRPPPQEKPAIHPNYTTGEDIRSYHYPHAQSTSTHTPSTSQAVSSLKPAQGLNHPLPSNANIGSNGLPPPPVATFQQPPSQTAQSVHVPPVAPQSAQPAPLGSYADRNTVAVESSDGEAPWPAELEKFYDDFQREEAIYVAEGVWDRFPPGSRLFVGRQALELRRTLHRT